MLDHCLEQLPHEACGLLSGRAGYAETIWTMENVAASPVSFRMDERQMEHVFTEIKKRGQKLVGIYHSHPTAPPVPSPLDILCASYDDVPYIIVSLAEATPSVGCYRIIGKTAYPLPFIVSETP